MPWSRVPNLAARLTAAVLLFLAAFFAINVLSPASSRLWTSVVLVASVGLTVVVQLFLQRRTATVAVLPRPVVAPRRKYVVPFELPPPPLLVGREAELDRILEILREPDQDAPRVVVIHGPPGIGKTALAINAAHLAKDWFDDGALFAALGDVTAAAVLTELIASLQGVDETVPVDPTEARERFRTLTGSTRDRVLVVLDNAPNGTSVAPLLPVGAGCAVLVTSRTALALPGAISIDLRPLTRKDATSLLKHFVGADRVAEEATAAQAIVDRAGGFPLALQLAGASLAGRPHSRLRTTVESMRQVDRSASGELDLSYALLTEDERDALVLLGLLDSHTFTPWMLAALLGSDERKAWRLCERLVHARLLEHVTDDATGVAAFRVLEKVHDYARERLAAEPPDKARRRREAALHRLRERRLVRGRRNPRAMLNEFVYPELEKGLLSRALNHARGALAQARETLEIVEDEAATEPGTPETTARLATARNGEGLALAALAEVLAELGGVDDAMEIAEKALRITSLPATARALRCIGKLRRRQRRLVDANAALDDALRVAEATQDRPEQARVLRELAIVHAGNGRTQTGLAAVRQAMELGIDGETAARLRASLLWAKAVVLLDSVESRHGPEEHLVEADRALRDADRAAAAHGQRLWQAWVGLQRARAVRRMHRFDLGRVLAFRAMDEFAQMRHRYGTARCRLEVGRSYLQQDRPLEALPVLEEARQTLSTCGDRWIEAETAVELARAQRLVGRVAEAEHELRLAIAYYEELGDKTGRDSAAATLEGLRRTPRESPEPRVLAALWGPTVSGGQPA